MQHAADRTPDETARRILRRLFLLRNITILGAGLGIAIAQVSYKLELPLPPLLLTLGLLALLNLLTWLRLKLQFSIANSELFVQLLLDIAGITSLFFFTGGATNPFVWFYLLPLIFRRKVAFWRLAKVQPYLFAGGLLLLVMGMTFAGSFGVPRRQNSGRGRYLAGARSNSPASGRFPPPPTFLAAVQKCNILWCAASQPGVQHSSPP